MSNTLMPGDVRVGQISSTLEITGSVQSATLVFDERRGARLLVPYMPGVDQFAQTEAWFDSRGGAPKRLLFVDPRGSVTLVGLTVLGHSHNQSSVGEFGAEVVIFGQPRRMKDEYRIKAMRSTIDGLDGFADFAPVKYEFPRPGEAAVIRLDDTETVTWRSQGFTYAIRATASKSGVEGRRFEATSGAAISTSRSRGATPLDHLQAHRAIRDLLLFTHGRPLAWRSHDVVDDQFPQWALNGESHGVAPVETHFSGTVGDRAKSEPTGSFSFPPLSLEALAAHGMKKWTDLYADGRFRRAVQPIAEVLNGAAMFLEPQLMMLASALDYIGYFRFNDGGRRNMDASIRKCLDDAHLDWPMIGRRAGIASAIAQMNNDLKHPDREAPPGSDALACVTALARVIARAQVFDLLDVEPARRTKFLRSMDGQRPVQMFTAYGLTVDDDGKVRRAV